MSAVQTDEQVKQDILNNKRVIVKIGGHVDIPEAFGNGELAILNGKITRWIRAGSGDDWMEGWFVLATIPEIERHNILAARDEYVDPIEDRHEFTFHRFSCKYGKDCNRKNPQHFLDFRHPWEKTHGKVPNPRASQSKKKKRSNKIHRKRSNKIRRKRTKRSARRG